ncbi:putative Glutamine dumper 2 [Tripterygium wilfordii]|uniref:Putative Glutamine dumper 2 n=1 Tax=Tripterygium wilfordii TaxID=458696 RepID=A0A7J7DRE6_TRIWF|nr:putative Glutamine dumper 2 [Tripterygium wilfordii]
MRPENNTSSGSGCTRLQCWGSPMAFIFVGLAFILGLTATAVAILVCSNRNSQRLSQGRVAAEAVEPHDPKIVVIMAGDQNPTYLAEPVVLHIPHRKMTN